MFPRTGAKAGRASDSAPRRRPLLLRTARDDAILQALTSKVRVLSLEQIARAWWPGASGVANARRRLATLLEEGLLEFDRVHAQALPELERPLYAWHPQGEQPEPDYAALSYQLEARWNEPPRVTPVYLASTKAADQMGGRGGPIVARHQVTHDLHVGSIYLHILKVRPDFTRAWVGDEMLKHLCPDEGFHPDAALVHPKTGKLIIALEFAGKYSTDRLRSIHDDCRRRGWPYQLW